MIKLFNILYIAILLSNCGTNDKYMKNKTDLSKEFIEITDNLSVQEFEAIKNFILKNGDQKTYRNFDGNNPHFDFGEFDAFLGADIGQKNIYNDPKVSDFNQLTLKIPYRESDIRYYEIIIVREGDIKSKKAWIKKGMEEEKIYIVDVYAKGVNTLKEKSLNYLEKMKKKIKNRR